MRRSTPSTEGRYASVSGAISSSTPAKRSASADSGMPVVRTARGDAGGAHGAGAGGRVGHGTLDRVGPVGDGRMTVDLHARSGEGPAQVGGVGVHGMAEQQLGADGQELELHRPFRRAR